MSACHPSVPSPPAGDRPLPTATILIVEDEQLVAVDLEAHLTRLGYQVVDTAASGEEAWEKAQAAQPDLILMDVRLAGPMDGIEAARRIRRECDAPIVFLTAYSDAATLQREMGHQRMIDDIMLPYAARHPQRFNLGGSALALRNALLALENSS